MEFYDPSFTSQLVPLVKVALGDGPEATCLRSYLDRAQLSHPIWDNVIIKNRLLATKFRIRYVDSETEIDTAIALHKRKVAHMHSPLSPFHALSDLFPSGLISSRWFSKYTSDVPFASVCVYTLGDDRNQDAQLAEILAVNRKKYLAYNVRFVAVIVSSAADNEDIQSRLAQLRQVSGLANLLGLFHLLLLDDTMDSECEILASSLLNALKTSATDFYSAIVLRVKERFKKYYTMPRSETKTSIELLPRILETRNMIKQGVLLQLMHPHNVESSISLLEQSYNSLLELLTKHISHFFSKSKTAHDWEVYVQWRTLLDIVAIHLVRGYFSIENSILAMKRHAAHVKSISQLLNEYSQPGAKIWIATQYHWLAELMELIPYSVSQELRNTASTKGKKSKEYTEYLGGILLSDKSLLVTSSNLLYKMAASELKGVTEFALSSEPLGSSFTSIEDILTYKIKLCGFARESTTTSDSAFLSSFEVLLLVDIADSYLNLGDYVKSVHFYEEAQSKCTFPAWNTIYQLISTKLISAAASANDCSNLMKQLVNLSILRKTAIGQTFRDSDLSKCHDIDLCEHPRIVDADIALFNQSFDDEVRVYDTVITQIGLTSHFHSNVFERAIVDGNISISLDEIDVKYDNGNVVRIVHSGTQNTQLQVASPKSNKAEFNLSRFGKKALVLQMKQEVTSTGWLLVTELNFAMTIRVKLKNNEILLKKQELVIADCKKIKHTFDIYVADQEGVIGKLRKELKGRISSKVFVDPYKPDLEIQAKLTSHTIIIGEKFEAPIKLALPGSSLAHIECESVKLSVESIVYEDMIESKELRAQANWDSLKDDEPIDLLHAIQSETKEHQHVLRVRITKSPSSRVSEDRDIKMILYFKLIVTSASTENSEFNLTQMELKVLSRPFSQTLAILPSSFTHGSPSILNPFVIGVESEGLSMPRLSRSWQLETRVQDIHNILLLGEISISDTKLHLRSTTPEVTSTWLDELSHKDLTYSRVFATSGKYRPTTSNVKIIANISFNYKREGTNAENSYETEEEEFVLPLQNPRVLLRADKLDALIRFNFTIENPTSRILTVSTMLTTDKAMIRGTSWEFQDTRNESPLKQTITPILPFSQHELEYFATYATEKNSPCAIDLPQLQVYDMQYKVNLPTIALQNNVKVTDSRSCIEI